MKKNYWDNIKKPILILAPMEGVTDTVFRRMLSRISPPDVFMTEFTSTDGICSPGFERVAERLLFTEEERPIEAQIWGNNPEYFLKAAKIIKELNFDGININMGCPVKEIVKSGGGSALIGEYSLSAEIIAAVKEGCQGLPVSVKTRIGRKNIVTGEWIGWLANQGLAAITVHGRTAAEMSKVPAHWDEIAKAVAARNQANSRTLIIGNGDVKSRPEAITKARLYKTDGIMIGRGVFTNMAVFNQNGMKLSQKECLTRMAEHAEMFQLFWKGKKNFVEFRKNIKIYMRGFAGATRLRNNLMQAKTAEELNKMINRQGDF